MSLLATSILNVVPALKSGLTPIESAVNTPLLPKNPIRAYKLRNAMTPFQRSRARDNWAFSIHSVKKINLATLLFRAPRMVYTKTVINSSTFPEASLGYLLKSFQSKVFHDWTLTACSREMWFLTPKCK